MTFLNRIFTLNKKQTLLCSLLSLTAITGCASDTKDWNLEKEESGISAYSREVANHSINEVRGETKIKATVSQLVNLFMDLDKCELFSENCHLAKILNRKSDNEFDLYKMIKNPAPFSDRDVLLKVNVEKSSEGTVLISYQDIKGNMAQDECCLRLKSDKGFWKFAPMSDGYTVSVWGMASSLA
jgi:hypothetical protein